jgi:hypothetical protein
METLRSKRALGACINTLSRTHVELELVWGEEQWLEKSGGRRRRAREKKGPEKSIGEKGRGQEKTSGRCRGPRVAKSAPSLPFCGPGCYPAPQTYSCSCLALGA